MELAANVIGPTRRSYWVINNRFAAGAYPGKNGPSDNPDDPDALKRLVDEGINVTINLTQDYLGGTDWFLSRYDAGGKGNVSIERFPIVDGSIPSNKLMREILDSINTHLDAGKNVYVHCWGGSGRTGTVVGCWLLEKGLAESGNILDVLHVLRMGDLDGGHNPTPEKIEQVEFILNWIR